MGYDIRRERISICITGGQEGLPCNGWWRLGCTNILSKDCNFIAFIHEFP